MSPTIITTNLCYHSKTEILHIVEFIIGHNADIVFIQEANGCLPNLVRQLRTRARFEHASYCTHTHIIIKSGKFIRSPDRWPHNLCVRVSIGEIIFQLLNVHLCKLFFQTPCVRTERAHRGLYRNRMINYAIRTSTRDKCELIVAGDFNSTYKPHKSLVNICTLDKLIMSDFSSVSTWPAPRITIRWNNYLISQCDEPESHNGCSRACSPPCSARLPQLKPNNWKTSHTPPLHAIDYILVSPAIANNMNYIRIETSPLLWYSDHMAVIAHIKFPYPDPTGVIHPIPPISSPPPSANSKSMTVSWSKNKWRIRASGLDGEFGNYVDIVNLRYPYKSLGWWYVHGMCDTDDVVVADTCAYYHFASFDFTHVPCEDDDLMAILYDESMSAIISSVVVITP